MRTDVYDRITNRIISELEKGARPWHRPWSAEHAVGRITRPLRANGIPYQGVNVLMLWSAALDKGYAAPIWMTFKQALELKASVRKGEHGSLVVYADKIIRNETDTDTGEESERAIPFMKGYTVFNVEQIDGLPEHYYAKPAPRTETVPRIERVERDDITDYHSVAWDQRESDRKIALIDRAEALLCSKETPRLPTIPMPWRKVSKSPRREWRDTKGYARNDNVFLYDLGEKMIPEICLEAIFGDADRRAKFLTFVSELLEYTFQEVVPPFAKSRRDHHGNIPFEWVYRFSAWCGELCAHLTYDEAKSILTRIWAMDAETALLMLQSVMRLFMIRGLLRPGEISDEHLALWSEMVDWLFKSPEWIHNGRRDHLDRDFTYCAFASLFCVAPDFSPLVCGIDPGWPHLKKFLPIIQRAICEFGVNVTLYLAVTTFLKRGGMDLMPDPALAWLRSVVEDRKADQKFWESNGENTVEVLKLLISQKGDLLTAEHRKSIILIADILIDNGVRGAGFLQQELLRAA